MRGTGRSFPRCGNQARHPRSGACSWSCPRLYCRGQGRGICAPPESALEAQKGQGETHLGPSSFPSQSKHPYKHGAYSRLAEAGLPRPMYDTQFLRIGNRCFSRRLTVNLPKVGHSTCLAYRRALSDKCRRNRNRSKGQGDLPFAEPAPASSTRQPDLRRDLLAARPVDPESWTRNSWIF